MFLDSSVRRARAHGWVWAAGALCLVLVALPTSPPAAAAETHGLAPVSDPAALVDPFVGTGIGTVYPGDVSTFPGADVPFGMLQWSPDTTPSLGDGGSYHYGADDISGFSLTHLSGAGCAVFGDVPILPVAGAVPADPATTVEPFSHSSEEASPGRYQVTLGTQPVTVRLGVTTRTGLGQFTFPAGNANVLFNVSGSANGIVASSVRVVGTDEVTGSVTSGQFCGTQTSYTLHFVARFAHPFAAAGVWDAQGDHSGTTSCSGTATAPCGAWVTFAPSAPRTEAVKVGISYVSAANAAGNLAAEDRGWDLHKVQADAAAAWNAALGRIAVGGGRRVAQRTFYTALYHSLLAPTVFSDANGEYMGMDGTAHDSGHRMQYANFSEWDIYRSEVQLLSMIEPARVADMMQSLVNDAQQSGWLPTWEVADSNAGVMTGDSSDPIIADAYAFGVRGFDAPAAYAAMMKGATSVAVQPSGAEERQGLTEDLQRGYVQDDEMGLTSGVTIGGSVTLEYALDDFAIAQVADDLGHRAEARTLMQRAQSWENQFNPATGYIEARQSDGSFPTGPALQVYNAALQALGLTQEGFQEGNAIQYTWSVPQDLSHLFALMGGDKAATTTLDTFFTQDNAGPFLPYDWSGNEPDLGAPWEFDYAGSPWRTQQVVRQIARTEYSLTPAGEPGNDDLGALASWYVWATLGLYPLTPGTADLVLASPMFPSVTIHMAGGKVLELRATGAPDTYVHKVTVARAGRAAATWNQDWFPASILRTGGTVSFTLGPHPDRTWAAGPASAPPSFTEMASPVVGYTAPSGSIRAQPGTRVPVRFGVQSGSVHGAVVTWRATSSAGVTVVPASGSLRLSGAAADGPYPRTGTTVAVTTTSSGPGTVTFTLTADGSAVRVPSIVLEVNPAL